LSDKELGKKMVERTELEYFLDAYKYATGQRLELVYSHEKPDFICNQPHGMLVGVELTQVMRDPRDALWDTIIKKKEEMNPYDAVEILYSLLEKKDISRAKNYGKWADNCMLVFQIKECPISAIMPYIVKDDYDSHGFSELWIADYSTLDTYRAIELFGLSPQMWGYHKNPSCSGKPYG